MNRLEMDKVASVKHKAFLKELADLLKKYNASLSPSFEGDSHGIYNEGISVGFVHEDLKTANGFNYLTDIDLDEEFID